MNTFFNIKQNQPTSKSIDEIDSLFTELQSHVQSTKLPKNVLNSFQIKETLNQEIWPNNKLNPKVAIQLKKIALDFFDNLLLDKKITLKDILFTGSLANYNWSNFSDIDLHIVLDFSEFSNEYELVKDYFWAQKAIWNEKHKIKIFDFPIELYIQDMNEKHTSNGIYSVLKEKWLVKPQKESFKIDKIKLQNKVSNFFIALKDLKNQYENENYHIVIEKSLELKKKLFAMRKAGLENGGELSIENLAFKALRRTNFIEQLSNLRDKAYDKGMSLMERLTETQNTGGVLLIKGEKLPDNTRRLFVTIINNIVQGPNGQQIAILGNTFFRMTKINGKPTYEKINWNSTTSMLKAAGLKGKAVGLNQNKTPFYQTSLDCTDFNTMLSKLKDVITQMPDIKWYQ